MRVRPLSRAEQDRGFFNIVNVVDEKLVVLYDPADAVNSGSLELGQQRGREKQFTFDFVFDRHAGPEEVFDKSVRSALDGVLEGFNATVFAYGATGAGKTHTMLGAENQVGVVELAFAELFRKVEEQRRSKEFKILMSYLEIYNETVRDLLLQQTADKALEIREDALRGTIVSNLTEVVAASVEEVMTLLRIGNKNRTAEATNANETSSRSHAVLQVIVEARDRLGEADQSFSKLTLVDLAGSERASSTLNKSAR